MPSSTINQLLPFPDQYLDQCRVKNSLIESEDTHVPPTADEARYLIRYLKHQGVSAVIVGSIGILWHLHGTPEESAFRPTHDLDLFVKVNDEQLRKIGPPTDWTPDSDSIGVTSWISPSSGYVDFLTAGHEFPTGEKVPTNITATPASAPSMPVAQVSDLFRLKLASMRTKDLTDLLSLAKAVGRAPTSKELGHLNDIQQENLEMIRQWLTLSLKRS